MKSLPVISFLLIKIKKLEQDLKLPYLQRIYQDIKDQSSSNIYKLRKNNQKVRLKDGKYQLLLSEKTISRENKINIIDKILNMKCKDDISLKEHIENWFIKSIGNKGYIDNQYRGILDILATYYITNGKDISILTDKKLKRIEKYEVASFTDKVNEKYKNYKWFAIKKTSKEQIEKYYSKNKKKTKKWKSTYTYKINQIRKDKDIDFARWVYIDNTGEFEFDSIKYLLKNEAKYRVSANRQSEMDSLLCIKDKSGDILFYNMNLREINKDNIYPIIAKK